eukprot:gene4697-6807_t
MDKWPDQGPPQRAAYIVKYIDQLKASSSIDDEARATFPSDFIVSQPCWSHEGCCAYCVKSGRPSEATKLVLVSVVLKDISVWNNTGTSLLLCFEGGNFQCWSTVDGSINNLRLVTTHNSQVLRNVLAIRPGFIFPTCVARDVEASTFHCELPANIGVFSHDIRQMLEGQIHRQQVAKNVWLFLSSEGYLSVASCQQNWELQIVEQQVASLDSRILDGDIFLSNDGKGICATLLSQANSPPILQVITFSIRHQPTARDLFALESITIMVKRFPLHSTSPLQSVRLRIDASFPRSFCRLFVALVYETCVSVTALSVDQDNISIIPETRMLLLSPSSNGCIYINATGIAISLGIDYIHFFDILDEKPSGLAIISPSSDGWMASDRISSLNFTDLLRPSEQKDPPHKQAKKVDFQNIYLASVSNHGGVDILSLKNQ